MTIQELRNAVHFGRALDPSFGSSGIISTPLGGGNAYVYGLAIDTKGNIDVAGGGSGGLVVARYSVTPDAPTVSAIGPSSGPTTGGAIVTITGTNLANATAVYFGTNAATIVSDTVNHIVVTSPAGSLGQVDVTVATAGGSSATSSADQFTYVPSGQTITFPPIAAVFYGQSNEVTLRGSAFFRPARRLPSDFGARHRNWQPTHHPGRRKCRDRSGPSWQ